MKPDTKGPKPVKTEEFEAELPAWNLEMAFKMARHQAKSSTKDETIVEIELAGVTMVIMVAPDISLFRYRFTIRWF